ncbi:MAG: right-handed parallel beta-helix repeat-containing protein [Planctomycetota bacterium]|jgi:hypothetical protein
MGKRARLKPWLAASLLFVIMGPAVIAKGRTIYVDASKNENGDGLTWESAYRFFQDALSSASDGDEIWVAEGLYKPDENSTTHDGDGNRETSFHLKTGVGIYGGFPIGGGLWDDRNPNAYQTILSGDLNGDDFGFTNNADNSLHVVSALGTDATAVLDGFVITAGNAADNGPDSYGGGMYNYQSSPTLTNCTFTANFASKRGGAMRNKQSHPLVTNCMFSDNSAGNDGGGIYNQNGNPTLINCTFTGNFAGNAGGGVYNGSDSNANFINCTFSVNSAYNVSSFGGGIANNLSSSTLTNCILWANNASNGVQVSVQSGSSLSVSYCCLEGSLSAIYNDGSCSINWGLGNIADNPQFMSDNYRIQAGSPCIDAGDPNGDYTGQTDIDGEARVMGPYVDMGSDEVFIAFYYVDDDAPSDPGPADPEISDPLEDGTAAHPFDSIQEAVDETIPGGTIIVLDGTYTGIGNHDIDFGGKLITVRSLNGPHSCVINCEDLGRGFNFHLGETKEAIVEGFTIIHGQADYGGAIRCVNSSPQIQNCELTNNTATNHGSGLYCNLANPILIDCTISNNIPDGIYIEGNIASIVGTVQIISNSLAGDGTLQLDPEATLDMHNVLVLCNLSGPGTVQVDIYSKLIIGGNAIVDLDNPDDPNADGTIICEGPLQVKDDVQIRNTNINVTVASFEDNTIISDSSINVDSVAPYGQCFLGPNVTMAYNVINADGDRYTNLSALDFAGQYQNNLIYVTINKGAGTDRGELFEMRGLDNLVSHSCEPNEYLCQVAQGTIPDCNLSSWTLERLELIEEAKLNLTQRICYQQPCDYGGEDEVLYVKELILRKNSILNTCYNRVYYETLIIEPGATITHEPLLGFSLTNIALNDLEEFIIRVRHNNYYDPVDPNNNRIHVERIEGTEPDPCGMMRMCNLLNPSTGAVINARAKGMFANATEDEIQISFEYLFAASVPNDMPAELVIYLSDVPELLADDDPNRLDHYFEVARVYQPPLGRYGSTGSGHFGVYEATVPVGDLDFIQGVRMELELLGPEGTCILINNWDPVVACIYCGDATGDFGVTPRDYLTTVGEYGQLSSGTNDNGQLLFCLNSQFSDDGYVGVTDLQGWDWGDYMLSEGLIGSFCLDFCLACGSAGSSSSSSSADPIKLQTSELADFEGPFLISGKKFDSGNQDFLSDRLYEFDENGNFIGGAYSTNHDRVNGKLVRDYDGELYQINLEEGLIRLSDSSFVIPRGDSFPFGSEPRYGQSAMVYVGFQDQGEDTWGRPILDAAFDSEGYVYVTPVVVVPDAGDPYVASAKLELVPIETPPYHVVEIYDDPPLPIDNQDRSNLREIEVSIDGTVYVINSYHTNNSDILWSYDVNGVVVNKCELQNLGIYGPIGLYCSYYDDSRLYLAPSLSEPDANSTSLHVLSTVDLTLIHSIDINDMGHITDITENPNDGTLWAIGFTTPQYMSTLPGNLSLMPQFYDPYLAIVPYESNQPVVADQLSDANDLALPLSVVWTADYPIKCGGANLDGIGGVDFDDLAILISQWLQAPSTPSADIAPETPDNIVNFLDFAIFAEYWLESGCPVP